MYNVPMGMATSGLLNKNRAIVAAVCVFISIYIYVSLCLCVLVSLCLCASVSLSLCPADLRRLLFASMHAPAFGSSGEHNHLVPPQWRGLGMPWPNPGLVSMVLNTTS